VRAASADEIKHYCPDKSGAIPTKRPVRPDDPAASLVCDAAPVPTAQSRAQRPRPRGACSVVACCGHSARFERAPVAEVDGTVAGVLIGFAPVTATGCLPCFRSRGYDT